MFIYTQFRLLRHRILRLSGNSVNFQLVPNEMTLLTIKFSGLIGSIPVTSAMEKRNSAAVNSIKIRIPAMLQLKDLGIWICLFM